MELFKLVGKIAVDNADAKKNIAETSDAAGQLGNTMRTTSTTSGKSLKEIAAESGKTVDELRSDVMKAASAYKAQGMDASSAIKQAYADIGYVAKSTHSQTDGLRSRSASSWQQLKAKVAEYKAQGMNTSSAWRQASQDMKSSTESAGNGMTSAFKKVGAAVATYLTVDAIKNFGLGCIQAAADANAMASQFTQVFGELEGSAQSSLSKIASEAGITENRMKGSFTKIAAFAKTTGMDTESALSLTERSMIAVADSAAFYDRSLEETTESLQSFLKGNYENDAALGLSCTEITRNEAANKLYGKSFKDLSEAQKQLTLLQMVEDANALSGALGQAARESDTWTNVTGNLQQAWKDFQGVLGSHVLDTAVGVVKKMVGVVEDWTAKLPDLVNWCKEHKTEISAIGIVLGSAVTAIGLYNSGLTFAAVKTSIMTAATTAFGSVMAFVTSPITLAVLAIGALVAAFVVAYKRSETFRGFINKLKDGLVNGFNAMKEAAGLVKDKLVGAWDEISARCAPLVSAIKENLIGAFNDLKAAGQGLKDRLTELKEKFKPISDFLSGAFSSAASGASGWFDKLTTKAGDLATGALSWLNDKITAARDAFNQFADFAGKLWGNLDPLVTLIRDNLLSSLQSLDGPIQTIKEAFSTVSDVVMNHLLPALRDWLMPLWESLKSALSGVAGILGGALVGAFGLAVGAINGIVSAISGFAEAFSGIVQIVSNCFKLIVGIFTLNGEQCKEALQGIWDGVCKVFGGLWDAVSGFLKGFVDGVVGFFEGLWDTLVGHSIVPDTIDGIIGCFGGLWEGVSGFVSDFCENVTDFFGDLKDKTVDKFNEMKEKATEKFNSLKDKASEAAAKTKDNAVKAWETLKDKTSSIYSAAKDKASSAFSTLKDKVSSAASTAKDKASTAWDSLKEKTSSAFSTAKDKATSAWETLKSKVSSTASGAKDSVSSAWSTLKDKTSSWFNSAKDTATSAFSTLKSKVTDSASSAGSSAGNSFDSMKSKISAAVNAAKDVASSAFSAIKSKISDGVGGALSTVTDKFESIKSKISSVMDSAKSAVSSAIETMKSKFNFSWSLPKLKMPHLTIKGKFSIDPPSVPKFSISWYKKAMNNPLLMNSPTIFGYNPATGKAMGGGEAGSEVVSGTNTLMNMIGSVVESKTAAQNERIIAVLTALLDAIVGGNEELLKALLSGQVIKLNGREFGRAVREYA